MIWPINSKKSGTIQLTFTFGPSYQLVLAHILVFLFFCTYGLMGLPDPAGPQRARAGLAGLDAVSRLKEDFSSWPAPILAGLTGRARA
ncbi:hypothetical protein BRADI_1g73662v3 [Brachypodium distachyon]|uniref:Uncharacterized protein n=1 Tax=Brachypodium distachyon TaxID=15368 RepID=A0A2K2DV05_BRADI|nr:hypothetical protein BRADI_1g73662v3 [Brachypodium distachyon]